MEIKLEPQKKKKKGKKKEIEQKKKKCHYESMIWMYAAIHWATVAACDKYLIDY